MDLGNVPYETYTISFHAGPLLVTCVPPFGVKLVLARALVEVKLLCR